MSETYQFVDVSRMLEYPKCAIHCATEEDANTLLYNLRSQYPAYATNFKSDNGWDLCRKETAYTLFYSGDERPTNVSRTDTKWFAKNGYEVIPFSELITDQIEIEESDMPLDKFLGL